MGDTRARILGRALQLFSENGYNGTTMRMIAQQADCALGLAYRYFPSKQDLLNELLHAHGRVYSGVFRKGQTIDELVEAFGHVLIEHETDIRFFWGLTVQKACLEDPRPVHSVQRSLHKKMILLFHSYCPSLQKEHIRRILATFTGYLIQYITTRNKREVRELKAYLRQVFETGNVDLGNTKSYRE